MAENVEVKGRLAIKRLRQIVPDQTSCCPIWRAAGEVLDTLAQIRCLTESPMVSLEGH